MSKKPAKNSMNTYEVIASDKDGLWGSYKIQAKSKNAAIAEVKKRLIRLVKDVGTDFDFLSESFKAIIMPEEIKNEKIDYSESSDKKVIESDDIIDRIKKTEEFIKRFLKDSVTIQDYASVTILKNQLLIMKALGGFIQNNKERIPKLEDKDSYPAKVTKEHAKECAKLSRIK